MTHAAEGVPFVFTNAAHDNLISQEMHNSRQFARFCWVYLQCCWPNENFYERFECGNYVLFICVVVENGKWNCIATKFSTKSDTNSNSDCILHKHNKKKHKKATKLHKIDKWEIQTPTNTHTNKTKPNKTTRKIEIRNEEMKKWRKNENNNRTR